MKLYRNLAHGIIEGVQEVLGNRMALRPTLKNILIKNRKWGSNDRRLVGKGIIEIIRWKRKFDFIGKLNVKSKNYYRNLLVVWSIYNDIELEDYNLPTVTGSADISNIFYVVNLLSLSRLDYSSIYKIIFF